MKRTELGVAELHSVAYEKDTDDVFVTFKVVSDEYKELIFRLARSDDIELVIRGDKLDVVSEREE